MNYGDNISSRLICFAISIIKLVNKLPKSEAGKLIANQLLRSGTSAGANYEEARGAESRNDFIHKLGIVLKELKESRYWPMLIEGSELLPSLKVEKEIAECKELCAIIASSIFTAKSKK